MNKIIDIVDQRIQAMASGFRFPCTRPASMWNRMMYTSNVLVQGLEHKPWRPNRGSCIPDSNLRAQIKKTPKNSSIYGLHEVTCTSNRIYIKKIPKPWAFRACEPPCGYRKKTANLRAGNEGPGLGDAHRLRVVLGA